MTKHAVTVDLEDWYQSTIDASAELSSRFEASTETILEAFSAREVRATFFVLGLAAEKSPQLIQRVARAGHEVQSHGYGHVEVFKLTEKQFREDVVRAKSLLEDIAGQEVFGYRSPSFSIDERTPWALDVLAETGHRYDSSIFPMKRARYGVDGYPLGPRRITTVRGHKIVEAPVAVVDVMGKRIPVGGGGYFRLWPSVFLRWAWRQLERAGRPGIIYMHPYEYDPSEMAAYRDSVSWRVRLHQNLWRSRFPGRVDNLLENHSFGTMRQCLRHLLKFGDA